MSEIRTHDIFISYSRKDAEFVQRLSDELEKNGMVIFNDREEITAGDSWRQQIVEAIRTCQVFILVLSPDSVQSKNVSQEITLAEENNKRIIPVVNRNTDIPSRLRYQLAGLQHINMAEENYESGLAVLLKTLQGGDFQSESVSYESYSSQTEIPGDNFETGEAFSTNTIENEPRYNVTILTKLNVRSGPGTSFTIVSQLNEGDIIPIFTEEMVSKDEVWGQIGPDQWILISNNSYVQLLDEAKRKKQVDDIVDSEFFRELQKRSQDIRNRSKANSQIADEQASRLQAAIEANRLINNRSQKILNDRAQGEDQLGIKDEIEALAETLLLRDVDPPVAVGIMGGWGSGKSFAMYLINKFVQETRAKKIKKGSPEPGKENENDPDIPAFVGHIYQISFNAWTYAKSNLWASLMDTIFSTLNHQMQLERLLAYREFTQGETLPTTDEIKQSMLDGGNVFKKIYQESLQIDIDDELKDWRPNLIYWSRHLLKETLLWNIMRGQQVETIEKLKDTEEQIKQLKMRREKFEKEHPTNKITVNKLDASARQIYYQIVKGVALESVAAGLSETAKKELGKYDISEEDIQKYLDEARSLWGGVNVVVNAFRQNKIYWIWTLIFLLVTFSLPVFWSSFGIAIIEKKFAQVVSFIITFIPMLRVIIPWIQNSVKFGLESKQILEGAYATQQAKQAEQIASTSETPLPQKISKLQVEISQGSIAAYDSLINLLEAQAEEQRQKIGPSAKYSNLMEFVQSRLDAATYENQLGLMHQVRQDIDELTHSLIDNASPDIFPRGKPRVILYIDDLDRCPPSRVVEVLEAVQLLLSTKLFIIILGLDTRYVTRALEKEYKEILQHEGDPSGLDYIEKIIQLPYRVRPIEQDGLRKYLEQQMEVEKAGTGTTTTPKPTPLPTSQSQEAREQGPITTGQPSGEVIRSETPDETQLEVNKAESETPGTKSGNVPAAKEEQPTESNYELPPVVIQFKQEDRDDMTICCQKIALTPRSIKRLVNVFKLMKIFWFRADTDAGLEERDRPRPVKQAAISLLALSSAYPEVMREVFVLLETLYRRGDEQKALFEALGEIKLPAGSAHELDWQLKKYKRDIEALKLINGNGQGKFGQITLKELTLTTFNIVRSFSFVGDPVYWSDGDEEHIPPPAVSESKPKRTQQRTASRKSKTAS